MFFTYSDSALKSIFCRAVVSGLFLLPVLLFAAERSGQRPLKYEVRAVWITTVGGLDWPRSVEPNEQRRSLREMLDNLAKGNFNTIYFQVRGRGDALYRSNYEPWSAVLTGTIGKDPGWDPLEFVVNEGHVRGLEVHAWFNTFLVKNAGGGGPGSVVNRHPEWVRKANGEMWLDPGIPAAREYTLHVAMDIINRYDIDGIHFDFMRYPEKGFSDDDTYRRYGNRKITKGDWRRSNINAFISALHDSAVAAKPRLKVGVAPIGIYHKTPGVNGLQSFDDVYQDSREWLRNGSTDYLVPQVYWALGRTGTHPDFAMVAKEWSVNTCGRQVILGVAPYKADVFPQIPQIIDTTRRYGFSGNSFFRYEHILRMLGVGNRYPYRAFIPPMAWKDSIPPQPPLAMRVVNSVDNTFRVAWKQPRPARDRDAVQRYNVYRSPTRPVEIDDIRNLVASVDAGSCSYDDAIEHPVAAKYFYAVTAMDAGNNESLPSTEESVVMPEIVELARRESRGLLLARPVPARVSDYIYISYEIPEASTVSVGIFDTANKEIYRVVDAFQESGRYVVAANLEALKEGDYSYRLTTGRGVVKMGFNIER